MPLDFSRLHDILKANGTTLYKLSAEKVIGGKTREVLFGRCDGNISSKYVALFDVRPFEWERNRPDGVDTVVKPERMFCRMIYLLDEGIFILYNL